MYARLDSGFAWARDAQFGDKQVVLDSGAQVFIEDETESPGKLDEIGSSWLVDGGIGFRFNPWLRIDFTVGYRGGYALDDVSQDISNFSCAAQVNADITSIPVLINAYVDLGGVATGLGPNIVPYVGAGFGFARNEIDDIRVVHFGPGLLGGRPDNYVAPGGSNVDLAWAIMAGFSAPLPGVRNLFLDVGYRYLDSGKIQTDGGVIYGAEGSQSNGFSTAHAGFEGDLTAHEFKAGLRLMLP
jgi:opacity protein-like surface antigen